MTLRLSKGIAIRELARLAGLNIDSDALISSITADSRKTSSGTLFVACQGASSDGHDYILSALRNGAVVIAEKNPQSLENVYLVDNSRKVLSEILEAAAGFPTRMLKIAGITGTNGKTTTNWLVYNALHRSGFLTLRSGTLGIYADGLIDKESLTTADPVFLHDTFARIKEKDFTHAVLEVSSHGLSQERVSGIHFDTIAFTNLTRDHLDYHNDFDSYFNAKRKLFELLNEKGKGAKLAIVNNDCVYGQRLLKEKLDINYLSFGHSEADILCSLIYQDLRRAVHEIKFQGQTYPIESTFFGLHNSQNFAAAFGLLLGLGFSPESSAKSLEQMPSVPGRLEFIPGPGFSVFVDYAHTPDALENVLKALRPLVKNRLWVVFGCGGDRDPGKRPLMGQICRRLADKVAVTSDNPRTEDPDKIIADILTGCNADLVEADRKEVIIKVLSQAKDGDVILIAGKGHEDYQIIGKNKIHFSDQEIARAALGINT